MILSLILLLQPNINLSLAYELDTHVQFYSAAHNTDPKITLAIAMQESSISNVSSKNDIGMFQLNRSTMKYLNIDERLLKTNLAYNVEQHILLLKRKTSICKNRQIKEEKTWSCYHSYTPSKRDKYYKDVKRHISKMEAYNEQSSASNDT